MPGTILERVKGFIVYALNYQSETNVVILVSQLNKRKAYTVLTVPHKCQSEVLIRISSAKREEEVIFNFYAFDGVNFALV